MNKQYLEYTDYRKAASTASLARIFEPARVDEFHKSMLKLLDKIK